jgi:hypothetical protein
MRLWPSKKGDDDASFEEDAGSGWRCGCFAGGCAGVRAPLDGTIKEFQWTNPHSWIQIMAKDASGKEVEYSIEGGSPNGLSRAGWKRTSLKPGDKAQLVMHPLKDGTNGGSLVTVTVNGVQIGGARS